MNPCLRIVLLAAVLGLAQVQFAQADSVAARKLDSALAAVAAEDWAAAAKLYRELAADNPQQGLFWYELGTAEYHLKNYRESIAAYDRAIAVGQFVGTCYFNQACCFALLGEQTPAIDRLELAIKAGLRNRETSIREDTDLVSIRDTEEFRKRILPAPPLDISRVDGWRMDLDYLTKRVAETHYDPWAHISRAEWDQEIARVSRGIPEMKDHEIIVALIQLMVRIGDGHTGLSAPRQGKFAFHMLPVTFFDFKDGLYVKAAHPDYAQLVGKRVVRVGALSAKDAMARIQTTAQRDNDQGGRWMGPRYLARIEYLDALGISDGLESVVLTVADAKGKETRITVKAIPFLGSSPHDTEVEPSGWIDMAPPTESPPLWRRQPDRYFTLDYLDDSKIAYANFRAVIDSPHETLADFAGRVVPFARDKKARVLVIDVRTNNGGNNNLARPLLHAIANSEFNEMGRLFVITGRETFSACQNFCNWMDRQTAAIFVGEPTGSRPNFVGEGNEIILPYSGLTANASSRYWQDSYSEDRRVWIAPELEAEMTSDDYRSNRDPALAAILEYVTTRGLAAAKP
ncbi:MAG TPA: tetratricopeptide repeat protein [Candidatus Krumholzibacteria bacterium]|nr:tetratricopeptide repeat protein [Candidatus Krumholzibacteria bacterium]